MRVQRTVQTKEVDHPKVFVIEDIKDRRGGELFHEEPGASTNEYDTRTSTPSFEPTTSTSSVHGE